MESSHGGPGRQLDELASRREALRERVTLPWWWYAVFSLAFATPMVLRAFPEDLWFLGPACGTVVVLCLLWYARRGRGVRPGLGGERMSTWRTLAAFLGGAALAAVMIAVAELSGREWLFIPFALVLAVVVTVGSVRRQRVLLRDEEA